MNEELADRTDFPVFRGGDGVAMDFDGKSFSFRSDRPGEFRAKITGSSGTSPITYSWVELQDTPTGTGWEAKTGGRTSASSGPAYELNNNVVPEDSLVFMREKCYSTGAGNLTVYEFAYGNGGLSPSFPRTIVTGVQCVGNQLVVTYQEIDG